MVRVSLKNTFLSFDENDDETDMFGDILQTRKSPSPKQAASPRSRSVECPSPNRAVDDRPEGVQIEKLNQLLGTDLLPTPIGSPPWQRSPRSPSPASESRPRHSSSSANAAGEEEHQFVMEGLDEPASSGPSAQELKQLQRRLEEVCQPRHRDSRVTSIGSISSFEEFDHARETEARAFPPHSSLHQVWSSASVSTLASDPMDEQIDFGTGVEFDLTIEEVPGTFSDSATLQPYSMRASSPHEPALQRQTIQEVESLSTPPVASLQGQRQGLSQRQQARQSGSGGRRGAPAVEAKSSQVASAPADAPFTLVPWQRRPWPKEYRHGHVPKNLNLEEEYKHGREAEPTTLMIRNIPNHYTQRQLINELDDLGFKGTFDFLYIPLDKGTMSNVGYAFVNFVEPEWADRCQTAFQNYRFKRHRKIAAVSVAHIQGLEANLAHYENAAVNTAKLKQRRPVIMANISQTLSAAIDASSTQCE